MKSEVTGGWDRVEQLEEVAEDVAAEAATPLRFLGWLAVVVVLLWLGSCQRAAPVAREPIHVVTPVYIVADIVRQIGGDRVDAQWWVEAGQSLDDIQATEERRSQLRSADLVISRGEADHWTLENQGNQYEARRVLRLDQLPSCRDDDPRLYMWLSPAVVLDLTDELTERLCTIDPRSEKMFRANSAAFRKKVLTACDRTRASMDSAHGGFLSLDPGFVPLAKYFALGVTPIEAVTLTDPSAYAVKMLRAAAKGSGAKVVFVNIEMPGPMVREWENRLGMTILTMDATGSSAPGSGHSSYVDVLEYDLAQLVKGMAGTRASSAPANSATTQATP